jgi:sulfur-oxidizing protein SoxX
MTGKRSNVAALLVMGMLTGCAAPRSSIDSIDTPFARDGDPARGRALFIARDGGHCVLCHSAPGISRAGNIGPALAGVGARLTPGEIRLRIADITRVNPDAAMPTFHRIEGMHRVATEYTGKPVLGGVQVADLVAWLATLR